MKINVVHLKFSDRYRQAEVKRWHIVETARNQTLAEHSFNVMLIARRLFMDLIGSFTPEQRASIAYTLTLYAAFHDEHEVIMGDRPTCAKRNGDDTKHVSEDMDLIDEGAPEWMRRLVSLADSIEAFWFIKEYGIGDYARKTTIELRDRCLDAVDEFAHTFGLPATWEDRIKNVVLEGPKGFDNTTMLEDKYVVSEKERSEQT